MFEKYLAFAIGDHKYCNTIEEARGWISDKILIDDEYHPDSKYSLIYKLEESVHLNVIDAKSNYKYENEEDIPDDDNESEAWPYDNNVDEILQHTFKKHI